MTGNFVSETPYHPNFQTYNNWQELLDLFNTTSDYNPDKSLGKFFKNFFKDGGGPKKCIKNENLKSTCFEFLNIRYFINKETIYTSQEIECPEVACHASIQFVTQPYNHRLYNSEEFYEWTGIKTVFKETNKTINVTLPGFKKHQLYFIPTYFNVQGAISRHDMFGVKLSSQYIEINVANLEHDELVGFYGFL